MAREFVRIVPTGSRVLEIGCGHGDLLAAVKPLVGVGIDHCPKAIAAARQLHAELEFHASSAARIDLTQQFDYIILSDLINDLPDVQQVLARLHSVSHHRTRVVLTFTNQVWYPVLRFAERIGLKQPAPPRNWLSMSDVSNLLTITGWEVLKKDTRILWPIPTPLWGRFCNQILAPFFRPFCLSDLIVARPASFLSFAPAGREPEADGEWPARPIPHARSRPLSCSVIIPARNERANIEAAVRRMPRMGAGTEIVFVEGHSTDGTWEEIQRVATAYSNKKIRALKQTTEGKGAAVREAFAAAQGEILFILDADLTVAPEELPRFYDLVASGAADFVNGVRLVYPMPNEAMRFLNMLANKLFGAAFTWLLGQPIKDTLCGTKVLRKDDYGRIAAQRHHFGGFDPFGDFDLLFGAAKLNLRIVDLPIHYRARTYGTPKIERWRHGWLLLRMLRIAAIRLKFS